MHRGVWNKAHKEQVPGRTEQSLSAQNRALGAEGPGAENLAA